MKRPLVWVFGILLALFLIARFAFEKEWDSRHYLLDSILQEQDFKNAEAVGTVDNIETKPNSKYIYLKQVFLTLDSSKNPYSFDSLLVIATKNQIPSLLPGNVLHISGEIQMLQTPTNPGQFNEKAYYREKNIYYKLYASAIQIQNPRTNKIKAALFRLRNQLFAVYKSTLSDNEAGIVSAMLLGEKSMLDTESKELYQKNGIGHILAISGLHITIICMLLFSIFSRLLCPKSISFLLTLCFLMAYGTMTGFGVSVNRAILMMLLLLFSQVIGRSYEPLTAMAVSAFVILVQKPYAVFSSSFLLSYSAALGAIFVYPVLNGLVFGSFAEQKSQKHRQKRKKKEMMANSTFPYLRIWFLSGIEKMISSLLGSIAIWLTTFPVLLSFYYEIPTYSILLNLLVLPLVSAIVLLSLLAGIIGLLYLPAAKVLLIPVHLILCFYQWLCNITVKLPCPTQVLGCPAKWKVIIYYAILVLVVLFLKQQILYSKYLKSHYRILSIGLCVIVCIFLGYHSPVSGLQMTMLDVGQGDGIFIQTEEGVTILIDGGSTDTKQVGRYRIIPFLKYYGIRKIDYMIMTHADEDHISGQLELLEEGPLLGIRIGRCLVPNPDNQSKDENYKMLIHTAYQAGVPIGEIQTADCIQAGKLRITCIHPDSAFLSDSANAYSVTLSMVYGQNSVLLTGDLEKEGEEQVLKRLQENSMNLPARYDILKVAHHGSKNSSGEEYLERLHPSVSLISCGKKNRYGHPHQELLQRLEKVQSKVLQTPQCGAVFLHSDGKQWDIATAKMICNNRKTFAKIEKHSQK